MRSRLTFLRPKSLFTIFVRTAIFSSALSIKLVGRNKSNHWRKWRRSRKKALLDRRRTILQGRKLYESFKSACQTSAGFASSKASTLVSPATTKRPRKHPLKLQHSITRRTSSIFSTNHYLPSSESKRRFRRRSHDHWDETRSTMLYAWRNTGLLRSLSTILYGNDILHLSMPFEI